MLERSRETQKDLGDYHSALFVIPWDCDIIRCEVEA